jgi:hypothetical protein
MMRFVRVAALLLALLALIWYGATHNPTVTLAMCLAEPDRYDGCRIEVANETIVQDIFAHGFTVRYLGNSVTVKGDTTGVRKGEFLSLVVVFHKQGWLELEKLHIAIYRRWKIWVSVLPVILFAILFVRRYRFDVRHMQWQERR